MTAVKPELGHTRMCKQIYNSVGARSHPPERDSRWTSISVWRKRFSLMLVLPGDWKQAPIIATCNHLQDTHLVTTAVCGVLCQYFHQDVVGKTSEAGSDCKNASTSSFVKTAGVQPNARLPTHVAGFASLWHSSPVLLFILPKSVCGTSCCCWTLSGVAESAIETLKRDCIAKERTNHISAQLVCSGWVCIC